MKTTLAAMLMMVPLIAVPKEENNPGEKIIPFSAHCMDLQRMDEILNEFDELPLVRGKSFRDENYNSIVVFMNQKTKTFTILEKIDQKTYCAISVGVDIEPVPQEITDSIIKQRQRNRS